MFLVKSLRRSSRAEQGSGAVKQRSESFLRWRLDDCRPRNPRRCQGESRMSRAIADACVIREGAT